MSDYAGRWKYAALWDKADSSEAKDEGWSYYDATDLEGGWKDGEDQPSWWPDYNTPKAFIDVGEDKPKWWNTMLAKKTQGYFRTDGTIDEAGYSSITGLKMLEDCRWGDMVGFWLLVLGAEEWETETDIDKLGDSDILSPQVVDWVLQEKHGISRATIATTMADWIMKHSSMKFGGGRPNPGSRPWKIGEPGEKMEWDEMANQPWATPGISEFNQPKRTISPTLQGYGLLADRFTAKDDLITLLTGGVLVDRDPMEWDTETGGERTKPDGSIESYGSISDGPDKKLNNNEYAKYKTEAPLSRADAQESQGALNKVIALMILGYLGTTNNKNAEWRNFFLSFDDQSTSQADKFGHYHYSLPVPSMGDINEFRYQQMRMNPAKVKLCLNMAHSKILFDDTSEIWDVSGDKIMDPAIYAKNLESSTARWGDTGGLIDPSDPSKGRYRADPIPGSTDSAELVGITGGTNKATYWATTNEIDHKGGADMQGYQAQSAAYAVKSYYGGKALFTQGDEDIISDMRAYGTNKDWNRFSAGGVTTDIAGKLLLWMPSNQPWIEIPDLLKTALPAIDISDGFKNGNEFDTLMGDQAKEINDKLKDLAANFRPTSITGTASKIKAAKKKFFQNILQCVLLAGTPSLQIFSDTIRGEYPYGGRIIPIDIKQQENFVNALHYQHFVKAQYPKRTLKTHM